MRPTPAAAARARRRSADDVNLRYSELRPGRWYRIDNHDGQQTITATDPNEQVLHAINRERYETAVRVGVRSMAALINGQDDGYIQACFDALKDAAEVHDKHPDYEEAWRP